MEFPAEQLQAKEHHRAVRKSSPVSKQTAEIASSLSEFAFDNSLNHIQHHGKAHPHYSPLNSRDHVAIALAPEGVAPPPLPAAAPAEGYGLDAATLANEDASGSARPRTKGHVEARPIGLIDSAGGLFSWHSKAEPLPVHFARRREDHTIGEVEATSGGLGAYIAKVQAEAIAAQAALSSSPPPRAAHRGAQSGELAETTLGAFMAPSADAASPSSSPSAAAPALGASPTSLGSRHRSRRAKLPGSPGAFDASKGAPGGGLSSFMSDGPGLRAASLDRLHPSHAHRHDTTLASLGVRHPALLGDAPLDAVALSHHKRLLLAEQKGQLVEVGVFGAGAPPPETQPEDPSSTAAATMSSTAIMDHLSGANVVTQASLRRTYSSLDADGGASAQLLDPLFYNGAIESAGGLGGFQNDPSVLIPEMEGYLPPFPGQRFARRRPASLVDGCLASDAVAQLLVSEDERLRMEEAAIAKEIAGLDARAAGKSGAGMGGGAGASTSAGSPGVTATIAGSPSRRATYREPRHFRVGDSSRNAASAAAHGRVPLDHARMQTVRRALRDRLPRDPRAAALALRHKLSQRDGDGDGLLGDEELLGALIDLAPATLTASDVGHVARLLKGAAVAKAMLARGDASGEKLLGSVERDDESVPVLPAGEDEDDVGESMGGTGDVRLGVSSDAVTDWLLGLGGGREQQQYATRPSPITGRAGEQSVGADAAAPPPSAGDGAGGDAAEGAEGAAKAAGSDAKAAAPSPSRLDYSSKSTAYSVWRAGWEERHGAPARKEAALDALEPVEGKTWTRAEPQPFRVVKLSSPAPLPRAAQAEAASPAKPPAPPAAGSASSLRKELARRAT